jgi:nucleotide-binding universal stress UspA family protein
MTTTSARTVPGRAVVVGVSGAPVDDAALAWSVEECRCSGAPLVIAHACAHGRDDDPRALTGHPGLTAAIQRARQELGEDRVTVRVQPPPSDSMLLGQVTAADLLVVGPPSRGRWTHWGSTTQYVARHAPCPVVVARPAPPPADAPFSGQVVVAVDASQAADAAIGFAFAYAYEQGLPLVAVTVTADDHRDMWYDDQRLETHLTVEPPALQSLAAQLEPWERLYPTVWAKRAVFAGRPVDGLLRAGQGARLLVIGAHAGPSSRRVLLGSTTLDTITRATGPVAIVQSPPETADRAPAHQEVHDVRA